MNVYRSFVFEEGNGANVMTMEIRMCRLKLTMDGCDDKWIELTISL